ncbi:hypothetical protein COO60DRAFT_1623658 [Scenedesmus sp. NREL 46B-D3]|nr:hypothetical protein COO60DRAFT_1623658 [Scenedesmus sp. NREL 46B-D3]
MIAWRQWRCSAGKARRTSHVSYTSGHWQLFEPAGKDMGWGDLVFVNSTTKHFICVQVDCLGMGDPKKLQQDSEHMGRELFSLLTYIGYEPEWVRCTTWRDASPRERPVLPQGLLGKQQGPGFTQIDASSFKPVLLPAALDRIEEIVARDSGVQKSVNKHSMCVWRASSKIHSTMRCHQGNALQHLCTFGHSQCRAPRCAACFGAIGLSGVGVQAPQRCSACKAVHYCNRDCQLADWSSHKAFCKQHRVKA